MRSQTDEIVEAAFLLYSMTINKFSISNLNTKFRKQVNRGQ